MKLKIVVSTASDGTMKPNDIDNQLSVLENRSRYLLKNNINPIDTTLVKIDYDTDSYTRYSTLTDNDKGRGVVIESDEINDALVTVRPNHALILPLADCVGAIIYEKSKNILMLSHLGRHSLEQFGGTKSIEYLANNFKIDPNDITVWLSPSAGKGNYPLQNFNGNSLQNVAIEQFINANINPNNITKSNIDTTTDSKYFSHSQFLNNNQNTDGRFMIAALITD